MQKVGVVGAGGRMGQEVCRAVSDQADMELVAAVDPAHAGADACGLSIVGEVNALSDLGAEVVVDFTVAAAARHNLPHYAHRGIHAVVGTTGLSAEDLAQAATVFEGGRANAIVAANFAIGAVLLMHFCRLAAPLMDSVEVIELHHDAKRDAPSGTASAHRGGHRRGSPGRRHGSPAARPHDRARPAGRTRGRGGRRRPGALRAAAGIGRPRGGDLRRGRAEPEPAPRRLRPPLLHARRSARGADSGGPPGVDGRARGAPGAVNP